MPLWCAHKRVFFTAVNGHFLAAEMATHGFIQPVDKIISLTVLPSPRESCKRPSRYTGGCCFKVLVMFSETSSVAVLAPISHESCFSGLHALVQALKPQWPADDCYHGCCDGETAPMSPAVDISRKEGIAAKASVAKETVKEAIHAAEDVVSKACF